LKELKSSEKTELSSRCVF